MSTRSSSYARVRVKKDRGSPLVLFFLREIKNNVYLFFPESSRFITLEI